MNYLERDVDELERVVYDLGNFIHDVKIVVVGL